MDSEKPRPDVAETEQVKPVIKMVYKLTDLYGQVFANVENSDLALADGPAEARYFDGSIETPYGDFMLECEVAEAKRAIQFIREFVTAKSQLDDIERKLAKAKEQFQIAGDQMRSRGNDEGYLNASRLVQDLKEQKMKVEARLNAARELVKKYKI